MSKYYLPGPSDGFLTKAVRLLRDKERPRPSFPRHIQIQTVSLCNARCVFCGYKNTYKEQPQGHMDDDIFKKIADECGHHFIGRISPYLMNEPLLDTKLPERIAYLNKVRRPGTKTKINTNGAALTEAMSEGLVDAGLRHLWISVQGYSDGSYRASMGLDLKKTLDNIDAFLAIRARKKAEFPKVTVTTLKTKLVADEIDYAQKYWAERDIRFKVHTPDNRSGEDISDLAVTKTKLKRNCDLFLKQAYVLYNGDMVICCHDWRRTVVLGNVREQSIEEIWNSPRYLELIRQYYAGDFSNLAICRTCTVS